MSSWVPTAAPLFEHTNKSTATSSQDDMILNMHLITCLESALEKRREHAIKADAPMPMGVGTSSFRTADRVDPATSVHEPPDDDEMAMEPDELASDELSDDVVLGMMEDADDADGMTDGSNDVSADDDDDDDDDDDNLTQFL